MIERLDNDHLEGLLSAAVDGDIDDAEWAVLEKHAGSDPSIWQRLASMQRDNASLQVALHDAGSIADRMDLPAPTTSPSAFPVLAIASWLGWAAAALIALSWVFLPATPVAESPVIMPAHDLSADDAFNLYVEKGQQSGRVVNELPDKVLLNATELPDGGYELLYLRQVLEREIVPELYELRGTDEGGRPTFVHHQPAPSLAM